MRGWRGLLEATQFLFKCKVIFVSSSPIDIKALCDSTLQSLLRSGALEVLNEDTPRRNNSEAGTEDCYVNDDSVLGVSKLGRAAIKGKLSIRFMFHL